MRMIFYLFLFFLFNIFHFSPVSQFTLFLSALLFLCCHVLFKLRMPLNIILCSGKRSSPITECMSRLQEFCFHMLLLFSYSNKKIKKSLLFFKNILLITFFVFSIYLIEHGNLKYETNDSFLEELNTFL